MTIDPQQSSAKSSRGLRKLMLGLAFAGAFVTGGLVFSGATLAAEGMAMHEAMGGHGQMHVMMQAHIDKMLTEVAATPDQKARIHEILKGAMGSMGPMHQHMAAIHGDLHRLRTAPTIDRAALENLRAGTIADVGQASKTLVGALADAAEVLTPVQRAKLGTLMAEHHAAK